MLQEDLETEKEVFMKLLNLLDKSIELSSYSEKVDVCRQREGIRLLLNSYSEEDAVKISKAWYDLQSAVQGVSWYSKMHLACGGIVDAGDDGFYMDFSAWLTSRGTNFLIEYFKQGYKYVLKYIEENNISRREYLYESMTYEFLDYAF